MAAKWFNSLDTNSNSPTISSFSGFLLSKKTLVWKNILSNLWMLTRLIYPVKKQIQVLIFEFSRQNIISNEFAGFLSKCKFKLIVWIFLAKLFPVKTNEFIWFYLSKHKIPLNFQDFSCQKSKFDLKKYDKYPVNMDQTDFFCQNTDANEFIWIFMSKQKLKSISWIFSVKKQIWFEKI